MTVEDRSEDEADPPHERGLLGVARSVVEQLSVDEVLARVVQAACELTGARYAALGVLDPARTRLERFITAGLDAPALEQADGFPAGRGVLGELIRHPRPLRLDDVTRHPAFYGFPPGHPTMRSFLGVPVFVSGAPYGNLYLTEKPAGAFTAEDEEGLVTLAAFAGIAIEHTRRYELTEERRDQLEQSVRALDATLQISRALSGETDLARILSLVAQRGRTLVSAKTLLIERLRGEEIEVAEGDGDVPAGLIGRRFSLEGTVAELALTTGETQSFDDARTRRRFERQGAGVFGTAPVEGLAVPLVFRGQRYGVLIVLGSGRGDFGADDRRLLESFASSAAVAIATAAAAADERRRQALAAAEAERARWARELHDETLQALGNLRVVLSGARRHQDPERLRDAIDDAVEQLSLDISSLRALITELRPAALDQLGLEAALVALMDRTRQNGLEVHDEIDLAYERGTEPTRLAVEQETAIYRIVQEALTNVIKHAGAGEVEVQVIEDPSRVRVRIADDGAGFDPGSESSGFGLEGIRERVELLDGELRIVSAPRKGTTLEVTLTPRRASSAGSGGSGAGWPAGSSAGPPAGARTGPATGPLARPSAGPSAGSLARPSAGPLAQAELRGPH